MCDCEQGYPQRLSGGRCIVCLVREQDLSTAGPCAGCAQCSADRQYLRDTDDRWVLRGYERRYGDLVEIWDCNKCGYGIAVASIIPFGNGILMREMLVRRSREIHDLVCADFALGRLSST
jgi:hypothetical protein